MTTLSIENQLFNIAVTTGLLKNTVDSCRCFKVCFAFYGTYVIVQTSLQLSAHLISLLTKEDFAVVNKNTEASLLCFSIFKSKWI